ncbi:hypothetical protein [Polyangium sp. y55x31]|uniref:hypothetical protein n=1 Tax=Polyangium sp. y55x31 TaxID=3042688 RepID=UPI002482E80A|nr:hypothetical protein [Polyangium sp. y55x31]MDI1482798.1 hypothetical protein [Polyangium sp. y55x31]
MLVVGGRRLYGKVEQVGSTYIATTFAFLQFLPLFPVRSHIVVAEGSADTHKVVHIKMNWKSVATGYLRAYGIAATLIALIPGLAMAGNSKVPTAYVGAGLVVVCAGLTTAAFSMIGRLSREEKAQRLIYARFLGHPVHPSVLDEDVRGSIAQKLRDFLEERAAAVMTGSNYRKGGPVKAGYRVLALEPSMRDREYLEAAFTLACIDASLSVGPMRTDAERVHGALWNKLLAEHPDVLEVVRDAEVVQRSWVSSVLGFVPLVAALGVCSVMLLRNDYVFKWKPSTGEKKTEYGFVPEELLR